MFSQMNLQVLILSARSDLIIFFKKNLIPEMSVTIYSEPDKVDVDAFPIVLFDASLALQLNMDLLHNSIFQSRQDRIIYIVPNDFPKKMRNYLYMFAKHIVPFPCAPKIIQGYMHSMIASFPSPMWDSLMYSSIKMNGEESKILDRLLGESKAMKDVKNKILSCARTDSPILLEGETGTGKTTSAKMIHQLSGRKNYAFVPVSCANLDNNLLDSALFGTEDGAYTDAKDKMGYIRKANNGTLFLDEIGMASLELQGKLFMFCDSGSIYSVGSDDLKVVNVRLISATNDNLEAKIYDGSFRKELYFRLFTNVITIPPLRERREDIQYIANHIAANNNKSFSYDAMRKLEEYRWPGNVRQLEKCIKRAINGTTGDVIGENNIFFEI